MGLLKDIWDGVKEVASTVTGWVGRLVYGGVKVIADLFVSHKRAKEIAGKVAPWITAAAVGLGAWWLYGKVMVAAKLATNGWVVLATQVNRITNLAGAGTALGLATFAHQSGNLVLKWLPWIYWGHAAVFVYGVGYEGTKKAIAAG